MTITEFLNNLESRYPAKIKSAQAQDIRDLLEGISPQSLDKLWTRFIDTYDYARPPMRADFYKIMQTIGIGKASKYFFYYQCKECGSQYSCTSRRCPKCRSWERTLHEADQLPRGFIKAHRDCADCKLYETGVYCPMWGREADRIEQKCSRCQCKVCCDNERMYRTDYPSYRKKRHMEDSQEIEKLMRIRRTR